MKCSSSFQHSRSDDSGANRSQADLPGDDILTAKEVAAELRCSKAHVYKLMNGEVKDRTILPHIALGRKKIVRRSSFEAWKRLNEKGAILPGDSEMKAVGAVN